MAKTKLKSVFTREDVYTVLQLLKALADGVDTNEELTDADIEKLKTSVDKLNSAVSIAEDNTTTIANGIVIKPTGDVDIGNNLDVDGNIVKGYAGIYHLPDGTEDTFSQYMDVIVFEGGDVNSHMFFGLSLGGDVGLSYAPITDSAGNNITDPAQLPNGIFNLGYGSALLGDTAQRQIDDLSSEVNQLKNKVTLYYQHTVHIKFGGSLSTGSLTDICFTALSDKKTTIASYPDLHTVFGGRTIAVSGIGKCWSYPGGATMTPLYLDLHGGTIETDYLYGTDGANMLQDTLKTIETNEGAIVIKDDVSLI